MTDRALLIEWEGHTGKRAGNINMKDPKLQCYGWQNMDVSPMLELRLVEDDRDLSHLEGVPGVTIIEGKAAINQAIDDNFPPVYHLSDEFMYQQHFIAKNKIPATAINIDNLPDKVQDRLQALKNTHGLKGIGVKQRLKI